MGNSQTFDPNIPGSIEKFYNELVKGNLNENCILKSLPRLISYLNQIEISDYENEETLTLIKIFCDTFLFFQNCKKVFQLAINENLLSILSKMIIHYSNNPKNGFDTLSWIYGTIGNLVIGSSVIAKECIRYDFYISSLDLLKRIDIKSSINNIAYDDDKSYQMYYALLEFIYYSSFHCEMKSYLKEIGVAKYLATESSKMDSLKSLKSDIKYVQLIAFGTIARLLNEDEFDSLTISNEIIEGFIMVVQECIENSKANEKFKAFNTKFYVEYAISSFMSTRLAVKDYLIDIKMMSVNDSTKQKLFNQNIIPLLKVVLKNGNKDEIQYCTDLLCSLCFNNDVQLYVENDKELKDILEKILKKTTDDDTKNSCKQINVMLQNRLKPSNQQKVNLKADHIMISYNHKYKEKCLKINDKLIEKGYKTWMDVNSAFTDLHEAMASAVENSSIVLICYSYEYKTSNNCRLEAQYACKLNKNIIAVRLQPNFDPDGWLGLILASKLYVDFSNDTDNSIAFNNLFKQIECVLSNSDNDLEAANQLASKIPNSILYSEAENSKIIINWKSEDVHAWLTENNLSSFVTVFETATGKTLNALWEMKQKDYTLFCNTVDKQIVNSATNVNEIDKLNFFHTLQSLLSK